MIRSKKRKRILLLDGQIFQTDAWDRGMGKYMLQLMKQLSELKPDDIELKILFNTQINTNQARYEAVDYLCPNFEQLFTDLPYAKDRHTTSKQYKKTLDSYINEKGFDEYSLTYVITTLFSFDVFAEYPTFAHEKAMIFYDLIPLMQWKDLGGYFPPHLYMGRFQRIYESDSILCISETTQKDVITTFGIDASKTVNINGGFTEHHLDAIKPTSFKVPDKYVLFPTGNLPHKNNDLVFRAFQQTLKSQEDLYLLVTSKFSDIAKRRLQKICNNNVIFTQNVSDEELQYLYKNAAMILFASKYEGLGLPVLDAVFHKKPVVASSISVFREMSDDAFFYFDMEDYKSASDAMVSALNVSQFKIKQRHYPTIIKKYDWCSVGAAVYSRIEDDARKSLSQTDRRIPKYDMKVAIVSLNPGIDGTIGRYAERIFPHIHKTAQTSYYFDSCGMKHSDMERPTFLDYMDSIHAYDLGRLTINQYRKYDYVFYLVDNKTMNYKTLQYIASLPGYAIFDSSVDESSIMYKAIRMSLRGMVTVNIGDENALEKITGYINNTITSREKDGAAVRVMKSYIPNRLKLDYLKRNMK